MAEHVAHPAYGTITVSDDITWPSMTERAHRATRSLLAQADHRVVQISAQHHSSTIMKVRELAQQRITIKQFATWILKGGFSSLRLSAELRPSLEPLIEEFEGWLNDVIPWFQPTPPAAAAAPPTDTETETATTEATDAPTADESAVQVSKDTCKGCVSCWHDVTNRMRRTQMPVQHFASAGSEQRGSTKHHAQPS
jgi:hypothetical protein